MGKADYLSNVQFENSQIQAGNQVLLDQLDEQPQQRGVEAKKSHQATSRPVAGR